MRSSVGVKFYLFFGTLFLYTSMTCFHYSKVYEAEHLQYNLVSSNTNHNDNEVKQSVEQQVNNNLNSSDINNSLLVNSKPELNSSLNIVDKKIPEVNTLTNKIVSDPNINDTADVVLPTYTKGLYISNHFGNSKIKMNEFIAKANQFKLNTFVIDVQPKMISKEIINLVKSHNIYPVARVVCFEGGLKTLTPTEVDTNRILNDTKNSIAQGFQEIQLDYIRYADNFFTKIPLTQKYEIISTFLAKVKKLVTDENVQLGADVFGRITLNQHDIIGQKLEVFGTYVNSIYPMVYPSHYNNDPYRTNNPYSTIKEGTINTKRRIGGPGKTRVIPYIQGFNMKVQQTGLSLKDYIKKQLLATADADGDGWVIWNARNDYSTSYLAIAEIQNYKPKTSQEYKDSLIREQREAERKKLEIKLEATRLEKNKKNTTAKLASTKVSSKQKK